jgi:hypothetical protein
MRIWSSGFGADLNGSFQATNKILQIMSRKACSRYVDALHRYRRGVKVRFVMCFTTLAGTKFGNTLCPYGGRITETDVRNNTNKIWRRIFDGAIQVR